MPRLHFDCFNGISGDMTLGALVDLGVPLDFFRERLCGLVPGHRIALDAGRVMRAGIMGSRVVVEVDEGHAHRHLSDVCAIIDRADFPADCKATAKSIFARIADAEARVHNSTRDRVHFHEVGAIDAIVDVMGAVLGLNELGVTSATSSAVVVGSGFVKCAHGVMPVPAPATAEILRGVPIESGPIAKEMTTPTGAAILAEVCDGFGPIPFRFRVDKIGYGAGSRIFKEHPNMLRLVLEEKAADDAPVAPASSAPAGSFRENLASLPVDVRELALLQTDLDDMPGELFPPLAEKLYGLGAREVHFFAASMKKGRPGVTVEVLADPDREAALCEALFRETTTLGVRASRVQRAELRRRMEEVDLGGDLGKVRVKLALWGGAPLRAVPEFADCAEAAKRSGVPVETVMRRASAAALALLEKR